MLLDAPGPGFLAAFLLLIVGAIGAVVFIAVLLYKKFRNKK